MTTNPAAADYLGMSDEDFLKVNSPKTTPVQSNQATTGSSEESGQKTPEELAAEAEAAEAEASAEADKAAAAVGGEEETDKDKTKENQEEGDDNDAAAADADKSAKAAPAGDPAKAAGTDPAGSADKAAAGAGKEGESVDKPTTEDPKPVDHKGFYEQVMKPFKANGRTIELKTPEEAIRLMQMGAGYGRKIQEMQPHLKVLRMLEKNDLLDEGKLSLLIDVNQKNPEAIKKIIKDSGIDPLDLNIEDNVYVPKNHSVSDQEMAFQNALSDIQSHEGGQETLQEINQKWDQESKSLLWNEPQLLQVIQSQRDNGVYAKVAAEIDRQKLLGIIPNSTPFLKAYQKAGNDLFPQASAQQIQTQTGDTQQQQVIATRTAAPKATVKNGDKAAAAAATKAVPKKAAVTVNPLAMADDDFLKQLNGRL